VRGATQFARGQNPRGRGSNRETYGETSNLGDGTPVNSHNGNWLAGQDGIRITKRRQDVNQDQDVRTFHALKPGRETSEFAQMKSADILAAVAVIAGILVEMLPAFLPSLPEGSTVAHVIAGIIVLAGIVQSVAVRLGYLRARTTVKVEAMRTGAPEASTQNLAVAANELRETIERLKAGQSPKKKESSQDAP